MARRGLCAALLACVASAAPFVSRGDLASRGWREANPSLDLETVWYNPATIRHELPYIGFDFLRTRADLIDYMKSIGFLFGGASL